MSVILLVDGLHELYVGTAGGGQVTLGSAPEKPASGKVMLRIAPEVHAAAIKAAARSGTSLNKWAESALGKAARKAPARAAEHSEV
jgi:predicted HicB family RNase H-like nuclease